MRGRAWAAAVLLALAGTASAREIVVSANDGKPVRPGDSAASITPDTLAVLEVEGGRLRRLGEVAVPASMTGPPESVKVTPDGRYAILTSAQQVNPAPPPLLVPGDALSVVDLSRPRAPRVVQRLRAEAGAAGVAIGRAGRLVLVANGAADSVSIFGFARGRLGPMGRVQLPHGAKPVSVRVETDGRHALVAANGAGRLFRLVLDEAGGRIEGEGLALGGAPSGMALSPDGRLAYLALSRRGAPAEVAAVDVAAMRVAARVPVAPTPEGVALSPGGRWLEVTQLDGSNLDPGDPAFRAHGVMTVYAAGDGTLAKVAEIGTGQLCQGAAWSRDERRLFLQCAGPRRIETYRFDGHALAVEGAPLPVGGRPGAMATRSTR